MLVKEPKKVKALSSLLVLLTRSTKDLKKLAFPLLTVGLGRNILELVVSARILEGVVTQEKDYKKKAEKKSLKT